MKSETYEETARPRVESVDILRGGVMVVMVLDHARDFMGMVNLDPMDIERTTLALFFTRWVTHFCAPVFVFLAGTGSYLAGRRGMSKGELARFLWTRGVWLIVLELTVIRLGLTFDPTYQLTPLVVIWVIGLSMIVMSVLVRLPTALVGAIGLVLIAGHNAFDGYLPEGAAAQGIWRVLHVRGLLGIFWGGRVIILLYPLIPWVGVMAAGYALGPIFAIETRRRQRLLAGLGIACIVGFVILRATNLYGDPRSWVKGAGVERTLTSFLNCEKYPPSLLYLLMTLGPALGALGLLESGAGLLTKPLRTLGRAPLFFYIGQWYVIHLAAIVLAIVTGQPAGWLLNSGPFQAPEGYGHELPLVYLMWVVCLILLYPPSAWFARLKQRRRDWWLSYF